MDENIWIRKYSPKASAQISQPNVALVMDFLNNFRLQKKRALLIHGPPGCGKTSSVYALASEFGLEIVELNASDFRNEEGVDSVAGAASRQASLFSRGKIILIDELDGISGQEDRGGVGAVQSVIAKSAFPVILTANDPSERKFSSVVKACQLVPYATLPYQEIYKALESICSSEGISFDPQALKALALRAGGDLRGAINDLQVIAQSSRSLSRADVDALSDRDRTKPMSSALVRIFRGSDVPLALEAFDNVDEDLASCMMWVDENLPYEYSSADLAQAYEFLSRADVFSGRIRRWQHWRFLVYINALISAGVAVSKARRSVRPPEFRQSSRPLKIYLANIRHARQRSIADKVSKQAFFSARKAVLGYIPFLKIMFSNSPELSARISGELELSPEEADWLSR